MQPPRDSELRRADLLLASFVVLLAFLLASTPARNSDLWLHLATGRAIAEGSYRFDGNPFAQDASSAWIVHSWLYDLVTYALFAHLGGTVLVILKASLVALLTALLVRLGTRADGLAWSAGAVTLALLAMAGRLLLQPALLSALLLAVTLMLLERARRLRSADRSGWLSAYGPICLLLALWANLDDWFLLGPLTVGLYLLGELIGSVAGSQDKNSADLPGLALALGGSLLVCSLTPFHIHGFTVPTELGLTATAKALEQDPILRNLFLSPFDTTYIDSGLAWSIPGLAYLVLVVLSALSFLGSGAAWRSWRLPIWLGLFGLSAWSARAVPFFAVAAGPILARNLQDLTRHYRPDWLRSHELLAARLGRAAAIVLLLGLLVAAWPGWLQGTPYEMRRWLVLADPSLKEAGAKLAQWRKEGRLTDSDHGFNFSPEEANYFAYFCPAEKSLVDAHLRISPDEAADYVTVRRALLDPPADTASSADQEKERARDWRSVLRARHINHVILYDNNPERIYRVYQRLLGSSAEWQLIGLTGRAAIFSWKDPRHQVHTLSLKLPLRQDAYEPSEDRKAPRSWPGRGPEPLSWWRAFLTTRPASSADRDEAALLMLSFETLSQEMLVSRSIAWDASRLVGAIGAGMPALGVRLQQGIDLYCYQLGRSVAPLSVNLNVPSLETLAWSLRMRYFVSQDDAPPDYLWVAMRAARRALHDNPDDAHAYLILGDAYLRLLRGTRERLWIRRLPDLRRLRHVQAAAALNQALILQPDLIAAHNNLAMLYQDMGIRDLCLKHRRELLRLMQARGPAAGESAAAFNERLSRLQEDVEQLSKQMTRAEQQFDAHTANYKIIDRAEQAAQRYGLGGKALELLLSSDAGSFGKRGISLELKLLLSTGRVREVREWMSPDHRETLGDEMYLQDRLELAAACGDYEDADAELAALAELYDKPVTLDRSHGELSLRQGIALGMADEVLQTRLDKSAALLHWPPNRSAIFLRIVQEFSGRLQRNASYTALRGLLALERGDTTQARTLLERSLEIYHGGKGLDFEARPLAEHWLQALSAPAK